MRFNFTKTSIIIALILSLCFYCCIDDYDVKVFFHNNSDNYVVADRIYPDERNYAKFMQRASLVMPNDSIVFFGNVSNEITDYQVIKIGLLKKSTVESLTKKDMANLDKLDWEKEVTLRYSQNTDTYHVYYDGKE